MSKHISRWAWVAFFLSMAALPLYAQHGCVDSPENPTAILGLVGAAGFFYSPVKNKLTSLWRGRRKG